MNFIDPKDYIMHHIGNQMEMKTFGRQGSTASSDTYASCYTHPPSQASPSNPDPFKPNLYVNPLDPSDSPLDTPSSGSYPIKELPDQCVHQKIDEGLTTTWQLAHPPLKGVVSDDGRDYTSNYNTSPLDRPAYKRHRSLPGSRRARFTDSDSQKSTSTDSINSQDSPRGKARFKKTAFIHHKLQNSSPSTGKKLANYQFIAQSRGEYIGYAVLGWTRVGCLVV